MTTSAAPAHHPDTPDPHGTPDADVIVVGAGISGMTTAHRLTERGLSVIVLEAKDRVGGRTWSGEVEGGPIDFGGMFIGETHDRSLELGLGLGMEMVPARPSGDMAWIIDGEVFRAPDGAYPGLTTADGTPFDTALTDTFGLVDRLAAEVGPHGPWESPLAADLDATTVAGWVERNISDPLVRRMHLTDITIVLGADPAEVSMLYWVSNVARCENIHALQVTANHALWIGGSQGISQRIATALGENVRLGEPVTEVTQYDGGVSVTTTGATTGTTTYTARRVVLAMPPGAADQIRFTPALPLPRRQLQARATLGRYAKVQMRYRGRPWLDQGWSGEIFDLDRGSTTLDVTRPGDELATLVTFIGGAFCDDWAAGDDEVRRKQMIEGVTAAFGDLVADPLVYHETIWTDQPYTMGGPVTVMPAGLLTSAGTAIAAPTGLVHYAGTEAADAWTGYMEGGVRAGEAAAAQVAAALR